MLKRFFGGTSAAGHVSDANDKKDDLVVAVCALFLEMGRIDETFSKKEQAHVLSILKNLWKQKTVGYNNIKLL